MVKNISSRYRNMLWTGFSILAGNAILAFAIAAFVIPNDIIMGGATGIGILINHFLSTDVAANVLVLNISALVLGYFALGKKFVLTTIGSSLLYPVFLGLIQRIPGIASFTTDGISTVRVWQTVTVAFFFKSIMAAGLPTTRLRPTTTAFFPVQSMP